MPVSIADDIVNQEFYKKEDAMSGTLIPTTQTLNIIRELADITTGSEKNISGLLRNALGVVEWVLYQQMQGGTVVSLAPEAMRTLERSKKGSGQRADLVPLSLPGKEEEVKAHFADLGREGSLYFAALTKTKNPA